MSGSNHSSAASTRDRRRGYRGLSAKELRRQRRQRLVTAGTALFGEDGYGATPIEAVCSRARVSTRHFYEQFAGRESILHAVHHALAREMGDVIHASLTSGRGSLTQRVVDAIESAVSFLLSDPRRGRILCIEVVGVSAVMEKKRRETTHTLAGTIRRYMDMQTAAGELPERDYWFAAVALVGMCNELVAEWLTEDTGLSVAEMGREARILFCSVIFGVQSDHPERAITL